MTAKPDPLAAARRLMRQLVKQAPKPHDKMKLGKRNGVRRRKGREKNK